MDKKIKAINKMKDAIESLNEEELEEANNLAYNALKIPSEDKKMTYSHTLKGRVS